MVQVILFLILEAVVLLGWNDIISLAKLQINQLLLTIILTGILALIGTFVVWHFIGNKLTPRTLKPSERLVKMYASREDINLEKMLDKVNKEYWSLAVTQHRSSLDVSES